MWMNSPDRALWRLEEPHRKIEIGLSEKPLRKEFPMGRQEPTVHDGRGYPAEREGKYLTFSLGGEEYGIGILKIREIIGMLPITSVPETPHFVKGVINLRGKVIPVVDLRLRFGMPVIAYTERTCIIVVEMMGTGGLVSIGIVVDAVSEVLNIKADEIEETPAFGTRMNTDYILGMAKMGKGVKLLLDIDRVLGSDDVSPLKDAA
jgi:purine-binding chemotaxis protein CheW